jgi:aspartate aminotransferase
MPVADKIKQSIENSAWIGKLFEEGDKRKQKYGAENVFDFSIGNPNLEPPEKFRQVVVDLINDQTPGLHKYSPMQVLKAADRQSQNISIRPTSRSSQKMRLP